MPAQCAHSEAGRHHEFSLVAADSGGQERPPHILVLAGDAFGNAAEDFVEHGVGKRSVFAGIDA
jgi:hypothetical protein